VSRILQPLPPGRIYQDDSHDNYKVLFCGMTGTGKTTLALKKILTEKHDWKIIIDQDRQWSRRLGGYCVTELRHLPHALAHSRAVCFDPMPHFRGDLQSAFDWICEFVWSFAGQFPGNKLLVMDDFPDMTPISNGEYRKHRLCEIAGNGRRRGLDLYGLCRAYTEACPLFRSAFSELYCFRQPDSTCADWMARNGFDLETVKRLADGEYLHLNRATGAITRGKVALPRKK
jgi:DNA polymerase III delta prime subunit